MGGGYPVASGVRFPLRQRKTARRPMIATPKIAPSATPAITAGEGLGLWVGVGVELKGLVAVEGVEDVEDVEGSIVVVGVDHMIRVDGLRTGVDTTTRLVGIIVMKAVVGAGDTMGVLVLGCMV